MIKELLKKVSTKADLTFEEARIAIDEIMSGEVSPVLTSSFLTALAMKGETDDEIAGGAEAMRSRALQFPTDYTTLDIVGTGGDKSNSFNISTVSSIVAASCGVKIAKHGNRAASSKCGSADCLEMLGVKIDCESEVMKKSLDENNIAFFFAQKYHSAMKYVGPVRKEIGIRTIFNILGPLTNPAHAKRMVLGVFSEEYIEKIARALVKIGVNEAMVVYGLDGLDEISACGKTKVCEIKDDVINSYIISPEDFGLKCVNMSDLAGGTPEENAVIAKNVLSGKGTEAQKTAVILNSAACIYISNKDITMTQAVKKAAESIESGKALETFNAFLKTTNGE